MKKDIFSRTKRKIIAISITIVFFCLIIFATITQVFYYSRFLKNVDYQLMEQKKLISGDVFNGGSGYSTQKNTHIPENFKGRPDTKAMRVPPNLIVILYNNGEFQAMSNNLYFSEDNLPQFPDNSDDNIVTIESNGYAFRGVSVTHDSKKIQILANIDSEIASMKRLVTSMIFGLITLIAIALVLSAYLAAKVIKPVREAYDKQVYFVQDASHEMRTPLAVIKGKLELLANASGDRIYDHFDHISKIMSEIRGLEKLNSDLLLLSKEDLNLGDNIEKFDLNDFIDEISEFYTDLAEIKKKKFTIIRPEESTQVEWDYNKIKRALTVLLENAFKYTDENGEIHLKIEIIKKYVRISVKDNGIGIKEEEKTRIFDRFYRSEFVRGKNIGGTGIGLSLLKSIGKSFGIKIKVNSEYGVGSEFILDIPKVIK
ncbi:cell wall metabolism sensor histidine kinase WalK [uncultured Clostridium sp.]|uniref:sensor histidine kinase n=1 Tax=uncultured Clostridium sp. TaxID=59620 RepID=UPI0025D3CABC|nr:HAMP domain-containing sensor histidine kinase [uncultured Clostridium sp.]